MKKYKFVIYGNQENKDGNPIPKIRKTGRQSWTPEVQRYAEWKKFVAAEFIAWLEKRDPGDEYMIAMKQNIFNGKKPIWGMPDAKMNIVITFADERHGDPESIFGSIADALFENDKHLSGMMDFEHGENGKVEIYIEIEYEKKAGKRRKVVPRENKKT